MRVLLLLALLAMPANAQTLPTIGPETPPLTPLSNEGFDRQWQAVGRFETGTGFCTGTLIAADLVLTAAHCLFDRETGARLSDADFRFNAALHNGRPLAHRAVRRAVAHPDYDPLEQDRVGEVPVDMALVELDRPVPAGTIRPIPTRSGVQVGDRVQIVSYGRGRELSASIETGCDLRDRVGGMQVLNCYANPGSSGAPVFHRINGHYGVVSVISGTAMVANDPVALAADLDHGLATLLDLLDRTDDVFAREAARLRTLSAGNNGQSELGARFIRVAP